LDTPFEQLPSAQRDTILHGTGEAWIPLDLPEPRAKGKQSSAPAGMRFQYKGVFPAIDEASRVSFVYRQKLDHVVSEVACSTCHGSGLGDDAAAVRFLGRTLGEVCDLPLQQTLAMFKDLKLTAHQQQVAGDLLREITNRLQFLVDVGLDYLTLSRPGPTLSG